MVNVKLRPGPIITGVVVIVAASLPLLLLRGYPNVVFPATLVGGAIAAYRCHGDGSKTVNGTVAGLLGFLVFVPIIAAVRLPVTLAPVANGTTGDAVFLSSAVALGFVVLVFQIAFILAYAGAAIGEGAWKRRHGTRNTHRYFE